MNSYKLLAKGNTLFWIFQIFQRLIFKCKSNFWKKKKKFKSTKQKKKKKKKKKKTQMQKKLYFI